MSHVGCRESFATCQGALGRRCTGAATWPKMLSRLRAPGFSAAYALRCCAGRWERLAGEQPPGEAWALVNAVKTDELIKIL